MSRQSLIKFLEKLDKELYGRSQTYREQADRKELVFTFNANRFVDALKQEFKTRDLMKEFNSQELQNFMYKGAGDILKACAANAQKFKKTRGVLIRRNQHSLKVIIAAENNPQKNRNYDNFTKLKGLYKDELDKFVLELNEHLKQNYGKKLTKTREKRVKENGWWKGTGIMVPTDEEIKYGSDLIEAGHEKGQGILESRMADAIDTAINQKYTRQTTKDNLKHNLGEVLKIDLGFVRNDKTDTHAIFAESRVSNQVDGFGSAEAKAKFQRQLREALDKLRSKEPIPGLKGSDSIAEYQTKKVEHAVMKELGKVKGAKVTKTKKPKATKRSATFSGKKKNPKVIDSALPAATVKVSRGRRSGARASAGGESAISLLRFISLMNQKLPQTVAKNMGDPALNIRTGRFASSVRVTEVVPTTKGFPSVGYTYMKNPYQTFEQGFRQGSPDRDPRKLIDRSIREIAAELVTVRLYTRRV